MVNRRRYLLFILFLIFLVGSAVLGIHLYQRFKTGLSEKQRTPTDRVPETREVTEKYVFVREDNLWTFESGKESQITDDAIPAEIPYETGLPQLWYSRPSISPDGQKFSFLRNSGSSEARALYIVNFDGSSMRKLADDVSWTEDVLRWSSDSQKIFYLSDSGYGEDGNQLVKIFSVNAQDGGREEKGIYTIQTGCGGGSPDPADHLAAGESIFPVGGQVRTFEMSPSGVYALHSTSCASGVGIFNILTKEDKQMEENLSRAVFSPDGERIASVSKIPGISGNQIAIYDLDGVKLKAIDVVDELLVLFWSREGKIYFSTREEVEVLEYEDEIANAVFGGYPLGYVVYKTALWVVGEDGRGMEKIFETDAHGLRPLYVSAGGRLIFSSVENSNELFSWVNQNKTREGISKYYPRVNILEWTEGKQISPLVNNALETTLFVSPL